MRRKAWAGSPLLFFGPPLYVEDASTWGIEAPLAHPKWKWGGVVPIGEEDKESHHEGKESWRREGGEAVVRRSG
jgi:hypothetical protein